MHRVGLPRDSSGRSNATMGVLALPSHRSAIWQKRNGWRSYTRYQKRELAKIRQRFAFASQLVLLPTLAYVLAIFCRRRHQARRPPLVKIRPGSPAPKIGPGTTCAMCVERDLLIRKLFTAGLDATTVNASAFSSTGALLMSVWSSGRRTSPRR